ncbi:hypothetical protein FHT91_001866 [Rhizobium sp. BK347]|nr:hypothetical protein [Rhizobium sp. BK252]MBB3401843.1 hypothetical protein [Rhizobium sp. BK289]MBB3414213.1 hypothetical protein [Rhizobium sp. BK284]MBB3482100.1 hypothetical protein [Rhizobium sp. BK347]
MTQLVFDLDGQPPKDQAHGLKDKGVMHMFRMADGNAACLDIEGAPKLFSEDGASERQDQ